MHTAYNVYFILTSILVLAVYSNTLSTAIFTYFNESTFSVLTVMRTSLVSKLAQAYVLLHLAVTSVL
jgi:hypothetical protein